MPLVKPPQLLPELSADERRFVLIYLTSCGTELVEERPDVASEILKRISPLASPYGDSTQRAISAFCEALKLRVDLASPDAGRQIKPLPAPAKAAAACRNFMDLCPFVRIAAAAANRSILESVGSEKTVHVVDLGGANPAQWVDYYSNIDLFRLLAARPDGPPDLLVLTVFHNEPDLLSLAASDRLLSQEAARLGMPFQFRPIECRVDAIDVETLGVNSGQALVVVCTLEIHRLLAYDIAAVVYDKNGIKGLAPHPPRRRMDELLGALLGLSPKLLVVTEQEVNHTGAAFVDRFDEALSYYTALFDSLVVACAGRRRRVSPAERASAEWLLGEEIKDMLACDDAWRGERHQRHERWLGRIEAAGFARTEMSRDGVEQVRAVARQLPGGDRAHGVLSYKGWLALCWYGRRMFSVSVWRGPRAAAAQPMVHNHQPAWLGGRSM